MEGDVVARFSRTPEEVFRDFRGRRAGMIKALTTDVENFYQQCDPEKENLSLYGFPNETWEVNLPAEEVPPELPEPALGINFARDGMEEKDWLALVAVHSDAWLLSVAFYFGTRFGFDKEASTTDFFKEQKRLVDNFSVPNARMLLKPRSREELTLLFPRRRLFTMINNLPTIYEVVTGTTKKPPKDNKTPNSSSKSNKSSSKKSREGEPQKSSKLPPPKEEDDDNREEDEGGDDEHENTLCGACGDNYGTDEFWICCDVCEKWFHGKCVKITAARAEHIKLYKCPSCSNKRPRV